jgi:hypothetical protein
MAEKYGYICMNCGKTIPQGVDIDGVCKKCKKREEKERREWNLRYLD